MGLRTRERWKVLKHRQLGRDKGIEKPRETAEIINTTRRRGREER